MLRIDRNPDADRDAELARAERKRLVVEGEKDAVRQLPRACTRLGAGEHDGEVVRLEIDQAEPSRPC
jgi:hypothetical protein